MEERYKEGILVALADHEKQKRTGAIPLGEHCIVAYGKYGTELVRVFPITAMTGDKNAVERFCKENLAQSYGGTDRGSYTANYAAGCKYFTRVMPTKDFIQVA